MGASGAGKGASFHTDTDRVQLSALSARLLGSEDAGAAERASRVQQLSSDYRSGRYQVDARELSRRLVDEAIRQ